MKEIGKEIGYDKPLTTYAARHSFATVLKRSGAPTEFISESLGHKSLKLPRHIWIALKMNRERSLWRIQFQSKYHLLKIVSN